MLRSVLPGVLALVLLCSPIHAQEKDPGIAQLIGLVIPGGGHIYAEEGQRAALFLFGMGAAIAAGVVFSEDDVEDTRLVRDPFEPLGLRVERFTVEGDKTALYVGVAAALVVWVLSISDAGDAARRTNARRLSPTVDLGRGTIGVRVALPN